MNPGQLVDCPELISHPGGELIRCSLPAEIIRTETMQATNGPVVHFETRCVLGHFLFFPAELLTG